MSSRLIRKFLFNRSFRKLQQINHIFLMIFFRDNLFFNLPEIPGRKESMLSESVFRGFPEDLTEERIDFCIRVACLVNPLEIPDTTNCMPCESLSSRSFRNIPKISCRNVKNLLSFTEIPVRKSSESSSSRRFRKMYLLRQSRSFLMTIH